MDCAAQSIKKLPLKKNAAAICLNLLSKVTGSLCVLVTLDNSKTSLSIKLLCTEEEIVQMKTADCDDAAVSV